MVQFGTAASKLMTRIPMMSKHMGMSTGKCRRTMMMMMRCSRIKSTNKSDWFKRSMSSLSSHRHDKAAPRVLVVGGGPVGLSLAYLLEKVYSVPTRVVERQQLATSHPRAHFLNLRTLEILHSTMPAFHDQLLQEAAPSDRWRDYVYCSSVGKQYEIARVDQFGPKIPRPCSKQQLVDTLAPISSTQFLHFPQNHYEEILGEFLESQGMMVERQVELTGLQISRYDPKQPRNHPLVTLRDLKTNKTEQTDAYQFVVGADGAHSMVRKLLGVPLQGSHQLQTLVNIHFKSHELTRRAKESPGMLYFVFHEHVIGVLIAHDLHRDEWVFQVPFFPPQESFEADFTKPKCLELLQHLVQVDTNSTTTKIDLTKDLEILSIGHWHMNAHVAETYDVARQVFLVGDAAHQFPPAGGFGMNTGVQDAHNLAWKIAFAIKNEGNSHSCVPTDQLLDSYTRERRRIGEINTRFALRNFERTMKVPRALNVPHTNAQALSKVVNSPPFDWLPSMFQRQIVQSAMHFGKVHLGLLRDQQSAIGQRMAAQVRELMRKRESLGMLFYHFDIGFSYDAVRWPLKAKRLMSDDALNQSATFEATSSANNELVFAPEYAVGARLPHFYLVASNATNCLSQRVSSLDLPMFAMQQRQRDGTDVCFVLLVTNQALVHVQRELDQSVTGLREDVEVVVVVDSREQIQSHSFPSLRLDPSDVSEAGKAFVNHFGAVLVRPDGHVAQLWDATPRLPSCHLQLDQALRQSCSK